VARLVRSGASFDSLARAHHDPSEDAFAQSVVLDSLPPVYRDAFAGAKVGDIVGPLTLERPNGARFVVVRLEEMRPAGTYTYDEMKDQIRETLEQNSAVQRYVVGLRKRTYVDIRP
jgi:parvulin-like peptidyl-prolyl isomerase